MKPKRCPKCGGTQLDVGDCGYSAFNVAWVRCKKCRLMVKVTGDSAVSVWNKWARNPIGTLVKQILDNAEKRRRIRAAGGKKETDVDVSEFAANLIAAMVRSTKFKSKQPK